jgi:signal transduction histidine kinase
MRRNWSLRRTLLAIMLALTMSVWTVSAVIVYLDADHESHELFDQSLSETAHLLLTLADHEVVERMAMSPQALAESDNQAASQYLRFQVWNDSGRLLYKNKGASDTPFAPDGKPGFGWTMMNGQQWRTYVAWDNSQHLQIQVGEPASHRKEISGRFAYKLLLFALLILPLMAACIWWAVNRVFRALQESANQVSQRTPSDLQEVSLAGAPSEVHPLLHAINRLFERVSRTLEHEQRFTADAAHELRTPLAAIKTNLQVIQRARNDAERAEFIAGLGISVDRATRLVEQLMTLARLDPQYEPNHALQKMDLSALLADRLPALRAQADKQQLQFDAMLEAAPCLVHQASFLILLRNLIDNAMRYTPPGGRVHLSCRVEQQQVCLSIADSGPGIPVDMRTRVFDRFFRLSDAGKSGSGLGLSIVKRIADTHRATVELDAGLDGAGLAVRIGFPLYQPDQAQIP